MNIINRLKTFDLFNNLNDQQLKQLAGTGIKQSYKKNSTIFSESEDMNGFHIILSGRVKIYKISGDGKEQILHLFNAGEPIGEVPVFEGGQYPASADALTSVQTIYFKTESFHRLIRTNPDIALKMLAVLSKRLHHFTVIIDDLSLKEVPARLARYLLHQSEKNNNAAKITLDMSKTHLASILGTIPETLSRAINRMSKASLIVSSGRDFIIVNGNGLEELSWSGRFPQEK